VMIAPTEAEACRHYLQGVAVNHLDRGAELGGHQSYAGAGIPSHTTVMGCEPWGLSSLSPNACRSRGMSLAMAEDRSAITRERWMSGTTTRTPSSSRWVGAPSSPSSPAAACRNASISRRCERTTATPIRPLHR
jgi:hypothetical protein